MRLADDKSDKFWRIETLGPDFVINWGKTGTSGRYELKACQDEDSCQRQVDELIRVKIKKGYSDLTSFCPQGQYYYDDDTFGLHPLTSHPVFRKYFTDDFYYSSVTESAPFGSDEGIDALWELSDLLRRRPHAELADFPQSVLMKLYQLPYFPPHDETLDELRELEGKESLGQPMLHVLRRTDRVIIASALAHIKITGELDSQLHELALRAIARLSKLTELGLPVRLTSDTLCAITEDLSRYDREVIRAKKA